MTTAVGIDPDTRTLAWARVSNSYGPLVVSSLGVIRSPNKHSMVEKLFSSSEVSEAISYNFEFARVEVPVPSRKGGLGSASMENIRDLAVISGASLAWLQSRCSWAKVQTAEVSSWKGQTPKHINQARTSRKLGWISELHGGAKGYMVPVDFGLNTAPEFIGKVNKGDWKHIFDAIGIAIFALEAGERSVSSR